MQSETTETPVKKTFEECQVKKGEVRNPAGRPKGSKNKSTLIKQMLQENALERLEGDFLDVYNEVIRKAKDGNETCMKLVWNVVMPAVKAADLVDADKVNGNIIINVGGLEPKPIEGEIIDV